MTALTGMEGDLAYLGLQNQDYKLDGLESTLTS